MQPVAIKQLSVAGKDDLRALAWEVDKRIAKLFVRYGINLAADCSNWNGATRELAIQMSRKSAPWLARAISDCCAWRVAGALAREFQAEFKRDLVIQMSRKDEPWLVRAIPDYCAWRVVVALAREFHDEFKTEATRSGPKGIYRNNVVCIWNAQRRVMRMTALTKNGANLLLENLALIEPVLFQWADAQEQNMPDELISLCCDLWPTLRTASKRTQKLRELARQLKPLRTLLADFTRRIPEAKNLKDHLKEARRLERENFQAFRRALFAEGGWSSERVQQSLELVPTDPKRMQTIARLCQPGADMTPPPPGTYCAEGALPSRYIDLKSAVNDLFNNCLRRLPSGGFELKAKAWIIQPVIPQRRLPLPQPAEDGTA